MRTIRDSGAFNNVDLLILVPQNLCCSNGAVYKHIFSWTDFDRQCASDGHTNNNEREQGAHGDQVRARIPQNELQLRSNQRCEMNRQTQIPLALGI